MTLDQIFNAFAMVGQLAQAICSCLTFFLALWAIIFAVRQVQEMKLARELDVAVTLDDWLHNPEATADRYFVMSELPPNPDEATHEQVQRAHTVWNILQRVARWVNLGLFPDRLIIENNGALFVRCWARLKPYIQQERLLLGEYPSKPYYAKDFERFAKKCYEYLRREYPNHRYPDV